MKKLQDSYLVLRLPLVPQMSADKVIEENKVRNSEDKQ